MARTASKKAASTTSTTTARKRQTSKKKAATAKQTEKKRSVAARDGYVQEISYVKTLMDAASLYDKDDSGEIYSQHVSDAWWPADSAWTTTGGKDFVCDALKFSDSSLRALLASAGIHTVPSELSVSLMFENAATRGSASPSDKYFNYGMWYYYDGSTVWNLGGRVYNNDRDGEQLTSRTVVRVPINIDGEIRFQRGCRIYDSDPTNIHLSSKITMLGFSFVQSSPTPIRKAFLCGNNYSALSGTFITALDYENAVSEWSSIPYLQSLYGGKLLGFALEPGANENSQTFVPKDGTLPEGGGIWYPVYERKKFRYSDIPYDPARPIDPYRTHISALWPELCPLANECVALGFEISVDALSGKYNGITLTAKRPMDDPPDSHNVTIFGSGNSKAFAYPLSVIGRSSFSMSSMLDSPSYVLYGGDAGLLNISKQNASTGLIADPFIQVIPYPSLTEEQIDYRTFVEQTYNIDVSKLSPSEASSDYTMCSVMLDFMCGDTSKIVALSTQSGLSMKTPYLFNGVEHPLERYYRLLGIDVYDNEFINIIENHCGGKVSALVDYLSTHEPYSAYPLPHGPIAKYETTIKPSKSGWYKFKVESDDILGIAIDDKLVTIDTYLYPTILSAIDMLYRKNGIRPGNKRVFDHDALKQLSNLIDTDTARVDTPINALSSGHSIQSFWDTVSNGSYNVGFVPGYYRSGDQYITKNNWVSNIRVKGRGEPHKGLTKIEPLSATVTYYSDGAYIYLLKDRYYKLTMWHNDWHNEEIHLRNGSYASETSFAIGFLWHKDNRIDDDDLTYELSMHIKNPESPPLWSDNLDIYPTRQLVKEIGANIDDPRAQTWKEKGYTFVPAGELYQFREESTSSTYPVLQLISLKSELSEKEKENVRRQTYDPCLHKTYNLNGEHGSVIVKLQQYLLKGPVSL